MKHATAATSLTSNPLAALAEDLAGLSHDPLGFVRYAYPWGKANTILEDETGPHPWQVEVLEDIGQQLRAGGHLGAVIQHAVASGHGVGKSALVAWLVDWAMSTHAFARGVVTANTESQLRTKTWPEVTKWHNLSITSRLFSLTATAVFATNPKAEKTWRIDCVPWSERNTEAFAGLHNKRRRILVIFDEASAIPEVIWETTEGALTDEETEIIWCVFGNPTRNTGRFHACFHRFKHRWSTRQVDARTVPGTNKTQIAAWVDDYGEDSDFVRVRVRGRFPRASDMQFIGADIIAMAMRRPAPPVPVNEPLIAGIDLARGGDDMNVIRFRRGWDARAIEPIRVPGSETRDTTRFIAKIADMINNDDPMKRPDAVFVDGTGIGGPIVDRLRQLGFAVSEVQFSWKANDAKIANYRTEMWAKMRAWLREGGCIVDDAELESDLAAPEYTHDKRDRLILESKDDMKRRGQASPDDGDALALTFAFPVAPINPKMRGRIAHGQQDNTTALTEYDPYG